MGLDPVTLLFYAFSRNKLKDNLARAEKEALKPVNYVMTENGLEQQTEENKNNPLAFSKIGNALQEIKFTKPAITDPATKTPLTIDEYKAKFDTGEVGLADSEITIPPVTGVFQYIGGNRSYVPSKQEEAKKVQKVGGTVKFPDGNKFVMANDIQTFTSTYGTFPQLKIDMEGDRIVNRQKLEVPGSSGKGDGLNRKDKKLNIDVAIPFKDDKGGGVAAMNLYSVNGTASAQATDLNIQIEDLLPYLVNQRDLTVKNKTASLVSKITPVLLRAYRETGITEGSLSAAQLITDPVRFVKGFTNLAKIPGLKTDFLIGMGVVAEENRQAMMDKFAKEYEMLNQKIVIGEAKVPAPNNKEVTVKTVDIVNDSKDDEQVIDQVTNYLSSNSPKLQANSLTGFMMKYKRDPVTQRLLTDDNNAKIPLPNNQQNRMMFYRELVNNKVAGAAGTEFNAWNALVMPKGSSMFNLTTDDVKRLSGHFLATIVSPEGYLGGHQVIKAHYLAQRKSNNIDDYSINQITFSKYAKKFPTQLTGKNAQNYLEQGIVKKNAAAETIVLMRRNLATYINPDGSFRDLSNFEGQVLIGLDGIIYFGKRMINYAGKLLGDDSSTESIKELRGGTAANMKNISREQFFSKFNTYDMDSNTLKMRGRNTGSFDYRRTQLEETYKQITSEGVAEATRNAAIRRYYRYMIAYQMAAAIQGGTGGRTISDQDVDNILRALGGGDSTGTKASSPATERVALQVAIQTMQDIYSFNKHITSPEEGDRYAALKFQELVAEADPNQYISPLVMTGDSVAARIRASAGTDSDTSNEPRIEFKGLKDFMTKSGMNEATMLEQMNQLRTIQLKPEVKSLDELINSYQNPEGTDPLPKIDLEKLLIKEFLNYRKVT